MFIEKLNGNIAEDFFIAIRELQKSIKDVFRVKEILDWERDEISAKWKVYCELFLARLVNGCCLILTT